MALQEKVGAVTIEGAIHAWTGVLMRRGGPNSKFPTANAKGDPSTESRNYVRLRWEHAVLRIAALPLN